LALATALSRIRVRGLTWFRAVLFLPQILPAVVVAVVWVMIYVPDGGPLNALLRDIGLGSFTQDWLGSFTLALPSVGLIGTWVEFGLCVVLFLAGIQLIPPSLQEAARADGAGAIREFFAVTLPGLRNQLVVAAVLTLTDALRTFDLIYIITQGGPGNSTTVPSFLVYQLAFLQSRVGAASAVGVVLTLFIITVSVVVIRFAERSGDTAY
jgi:raffinose/stachyose/melibiose transport system permease protein